MVLHRQSSAWPQSQSSSRLGADFRSGLTQAVLRASDRDADSAGALCSTGVTPLPRYYSPLRLPTEASDGYVFPPPVVTAPHPWVGTLGWVSQVPRSICRHPPSSTTPGSPAAARARCFAAGCRLRPFRKVGHSQLLGFNEAESGSLALRLTSPRSQASTGRLPITPLGRLHGERAIAMVSSFHLTRSTRLILTHPNEAKSGLPSEKRDESKESLSPSRLATFFLTSF